MLKGFKHFKLKTKTLLAGLAVAAIGSTAVMGVQAALKPGLSPEYPGMTFWNGNGEQVDSPDKAKTYTFDLNVKRYTRHPGFKQIPTKNYIGYTPANVTDLLKTDYLRINTGLKSSLPALEEGTHKFEEKRRGKIPVGYWVLSWEDGYLCHSNNVSWYEGITFTPSKLADKGKRYVSGWTAYCADCGRPVFNFQGKNNADGTVTDIPHVYMSDETVGYVKPTSGVETQQTANGVKYLYTNLRSWYRDPYIGHLEQSIDSSHMCDGISNNRYKVIYINNNSASASNYSIHTYKNRGTYEGQVASSQPSLSLNDYTKAGHKFLGWATTAERAAQGIVDYQDGADWKPLFEGHWEENLANEEQVSGSGVRLLYAVWKSSSSTLQIDPAGGTYKNTSNITSVTQGYGSELSIKNSDFKKNGYTVDFVTTTGGVTGNAVNSIKTTVEMTGLKYDTNTLHGTIEKSTAVNPDYKYEFTGENGSTDKVTATWNNVPIKLPAASANGYAFGGWYNNSSLSDASFVGGAGATVTISSNTTLYAKWIGLGLKAEARYNTKYNYNGFDTEAGHTELNWEYPVQNQAINYKVYGSENLSQIQSIASGSVNTALLIGTQSDKAITQTIDSGYKHASGTYTVQHDGYYNIYLGGAQGGNSDQAQGGLGGTMTYTRVYLSKGTVLGYEVGQQGAFGSSIIRGVNGGGATKLKVNGSTVAVVGGGGGAGVQAASEHRDYTEDKLTGGAGGYLTVQAHQTPVEWRQAIGNNTTVALKTIKNDSMKNNWNSYAFTDSNPDKQYGGILGNGDAGTEMSWAGGKGEGYQNGESGVSIRMHTRTSIPAVAGRGLSSWDKSLLTANSNNNGTLRNALFNNAKTAPYKGIIITSDRDWMYSMVAGNYELGKLFASDGTADWIYGGTGYSYMNRDVNLQASNEMKETRYGKVRASANGAIYKFKGNSSSYGGIAGVFNTNSNILAKFAHGNMAGGDNHYFFWNRASGKDLGLEFDERSEAGSSVQFKFDTFYPSTGGSSWYSTAGVMAGYTPSVTAGVTSGNGYFRITSAEPIVVDYEKASRNMTHQTPDKVAPNAVAASTVLFDKYKSDTVMQYVFNKPEDKGTNYYHIVEAYGLVNNSKLSVSNITKTEIKRGVGSYVYLVDRNAGTNITPSTAGVKTTTTEAVDVPVATYEQYLHIVALDKNKNYSGTTHVRIPAAQSMFPVHTTKINVQSTLDGSLYKVTDKSGQELNYVRVDAPLQMGFEGYINNPASDKYQVNRNRLVVESFSADGEDAYYVEDYVPNRTPFGSGDKVYGTSEIKTKSTLAGLANKKIEGAGVTEIKRTNKSQRLSDKRNITFKNEMQVWVYPRAGADFVKPATGTVITTWSTDGNDNKARVIADGTAPMVGNIEMLTSGDMPDGTLTWTFQVAEQRANDSGVDLATLKVEMIDQQNSSRGVWTTSSGLTVASQTKNETGQITSANIEFETPCWLFQDSPRVRFKVTVLDNVDNGEATTYEQIVDSSSKLVTNTKYDGTKRDVSKTDTNMWGTEIAIRKPTDSTLNVNLDFDAPATDVWTYEGNNKVVGTAIDVARNVPFKFLGYRDTTNLGLGSYSGTVDADGRYVADGTTKNYTFPGQYYKEVYDAEYKINSTHLPVMYRVGFMFKGWYDSEGKLVSAGGTDYTPSDHITLTAKWQPAWDLPITVYHYQKDLGKTTYTLKATETVNNGPAWGSITLRDYAKTYDGFTYQCGSLTGDVNGPGTAVEYVDVSPNATTKIYLFYTRNKYNVTVTKDKGIKSATGAGSYEYEDTVTVKATPNAGYTFKTWTGEYTSTNSTYEFSMPSKDVSLNAASNLITYTIKYEFNGGTDGGKNPTNYTAETPTFDLVTPTKPGWKFDGWTGTGITGTTDTVTVTQGTTGNLTFEAHWSKVITLTQISGKVVNGSGHVDTQKYTVRDKETSHRFNLGQVTPVDLGNEWKAVGWNETNLKGSATPDFGLDGTLTLSDDKTVYAVYNREERFHYGVDSELIVKGNQHYTSDGSGWDAGIKVDIPSGNKNIAGWKQVGLTDDPNGHTKEWNNTGTITGDHGPDFYEIYERVLTIKYDKNSDKATGTPPKNSTAKQTYNASGNISTPSFTLEKNTFSRVGYPFIGWQLLNTSTVYKEGTVYKDWTPAVTDTVTTTIAKAIWKPNEFYINYNAGTNWNTAQQSYKQTCRFTDESDTATVKLIKNKFTRNLVDAGADTTLEEGYKFIGWTDTLGKNEILKDKFGTPYKDEATVKIAIDTDVVYQLYPIWQKDINITLDLNGGTYKSSTGSLDVAGSVFNNRKEYPFNIVGGTVAENKVLGSQYSTMKITSGGSTISNKINIYGTHDTTTGLNGDFKKTDSTGATYRFLGWSRNPNAAFPDTDLDVFNTSHKTTLTLKDDVTLYAVWEKALALNVTIHRTLGDLQFKGDLVDVTPSHKGSATYGNKKAITAIIQPGEQGNYTVVASGNNSKQVTVKFDTRITDIYDLPDNPSHTFKDTLNTSSSEDLEVDQTHGLNRLLRDTGGVTIEANRKFYVPNYLGTKYAPNSSKPGIDDTSNYRVYRVVYEATQDSYFIRKLTNGAKTKENAIVTAYIYVTRNTNSGENPETPIDPNNPGNSGKPLETEIKTRIKAR